jgi:hypothetical protein
MHPLQLAPRVELFPLTGCRILRHGGIPNDLAALPALKYCHFRPLINKFPAPTGKDMFNRTRRIDIKIYNASCSMTSDNPFTLLVLCIKYNIPVIFNIFFPIPH